MRNRRNTTGRIVTAVAALSLVAVACGDDDDDAADTTTAAAEAPATTEAMSETTEAMTETTEAMSETTEAMSESTAAGSGEGAMAPSGSACGAVPTDGEGSFDGMADDPAATAASNNPALSTLVAAVTEAGLVDTLNGPGPFTIFAPVNDAFAAIPEADMTAVMADEELLTSILTYHVLPEQLDSAELAEAGTVATVNGAELEITMDGDSVTINGGEATVICQDVPTANATVHLIDTVLMPPS
jgi:uncharacterized surface protein with fasciclin (FAS1) repeats